MELFKLEAFFNAAPCIRLFRSPNAAYIAFFLYKHFKATHKTLWTQTELTAVLREYLEELHETQPDVLREEKPEKYLDDWCSGEKRWLRRSLGRDAEYEIQLTPDTEAVLGFIDQRLSSEHATIGTGSRLRQAIEMFAEIVIKASTEPDEKIRHLTAEKEKIEREIEKIQSEGIVVPVRDEFLREDFATAFTMLKQLQGDFRAVEERFKEIARQVQHKISERNEVRGEILDSVFEADDALKKGEQGITFNEFCRFLYSDEQQNKFYTTVDSLKSLDALSSCLDELNHISELIPLLTGEAERVQRTTQRLGSSLRRLLDTKTYEQRQRLGIVLDEIRKFAEKFSSAPPIDKIEFYVEEELDIAAPYRYDFWTAPLHLELKELTEAADTEEERKEAFRKLAQTEKIDWTKLKDNIEKYTANNTTVSLKTILDQESTAAGVIEVIGYLQIAEDDGHHVYHDDEEKINITLRGSSSPSVTLTMPKILFIPATKRKRKHGHI